MPHKIVAIATSFQLTPFYRKIKNTENLELGFFNYGKIKSVLFEYYLIHNFKSCQI